MEARAQRLPGDRLHLQHGPSDLIVFAEGDRAAAYAAATRRFSTIIAEVVAELPTLRAMISPASIRPRGTVARRMFDAAHPFAQACFVTPMAAVAGAIADEVLCAMTKAADLSRAYVNNGGDIAIHLAAGQSFSTAIARHDGARLGTLRVGADDPVRGIATSGRHGRSLSLGIADSVTTLGRNAAAADVAATLIANAVDLPGHPAIIRRAAHEVSPDSDLGDMPVVTACGVLSSAETRAALDAGHARATEMIARGRIAEAALFLHGDSRITTGHRFQLSEGLAHV